MSALDKVLKLGVKTFTNTVEDLGMRAADDTSASLVSQADVALKRIANKGENRQASRLDKELSRHGVTNFELKQANFETLGNVEASKTVESSALSYDPKIVRHNFVNTIKDWSPRRTNTLLENLGNIQKVFPNLKSVYELIDAAPYVFSSTELEAFRSGAEVSSVKLNPEQISNLGSKRTDLGGAAVQAGHTLPDRLAHFLDPRQQEEWLAWIGDDPIPPHKLKAEVEEAMDLDSRVQQLVLDNLTTTNAKAAGARDMFKANGATRGDTQYSGYALPDVNRDTYTEVVYTGKGMDDLGQESSHFADEDYQFHVRYDIQGGGGTSTPTQQTPVPTRRIFELQSDLVNEEMKSVENIKTIDDLLDSSNPYKLIDIKLESMPSAVYTDLVNDSNVATQEELVELLVNMAKVDLTDKQHDFLQSVVADIKHKGLPYNFRTEALKRQLVDAHNDGQKEVWLAIRPEGFESLVRGETVQKEYDTTMIKVGKKLAKRIGANVTQDKGWLKIALPAGGFSLPLLAEETDQQIEKVQGTYPASEEVSVQQIMEDPAVSDTDKLRAFRQSNRETGRFGRLGGEGAPEHSTGPSALSAEEQNIPDPTEMASKVQGLLTSGMDPLQLKQSLASKYDDSTANSIMLEALRPKIDKMLADGVTEAQIAESLQGKGIQYGVQNQATQDNNNLDIGQAGPVSNQAVTETESDQIQPIINTDLEPDEIFTQLTNIHNQYSQLGYTVLGWTGLSASAKGKAKQVQTETSNLVKKGMEERGYEVLSIDEFGTMMVRDKDTGLPREVDDSFLSSIGASGVEAVSAFGGAIAGAKAGALATAAIPVPGVRVAGAFVGGLVGGALGAAGGRGVDVYRHADDLNYELTVNEVISKMADAGVADATMGVLGTSTVKLVKGVYTGGKAGGRALARGYDLVVKGNPQGAVKALLEGLTLSEGKAIELVKVWERATGNSVLSAKALETGKLSAQDLPGLLQSLALTQPRATSMVKAASQVSKSGGSKLSLQLDDRAAQVLEAADNMTNDNIVTTVQQGLDNYISDTNKYFGSIKDIGVSQMADTGYRFDFNKVPLEAVVKATKDKVLNNAIRRDVDNYLQRIRQLSGKTAVENVQTAGDLVTPQTVEAANPLREFGNLLELRSVVNQFFSDSRFKAFYNQQALHVAKESIDKEIASTATNVMPGGEAWLKHWRAANAEYHKMKVLETNVLYKALTKETVSSESAVKAITKSLAYESPATFMQVMGKLPLKVKVNVEGAVVSRLVKDSTVGFDGGHKAINFVKLSADLQQMAFTQPAARDLKRVATDMAEVYKNDPHLSAAVGNIPLPKFQNALTTDVTAKVKYAVASSVFHAIKARIPFSTNAGRAALVNHLSKVLDNPLSAKSTQALLKGLPDDPTLKTDLQNLAIQYTKFGKPENYGKIPVFKVTSSKDLGKGRQTALGKGHMAYTDKTTADKIAKATGTKVVESMALPKAFATEVDVTKLLGHTPSKEELRSLDIAQALKDKGFVGLTAEDKVLFFKH